MPNKSKKKALARPRRERRWDLILEIVKTDSTFELVKTRDVDPIWIGKCIHCNSKLAVSITGQTGATIEHVVPLTAEGTNDVKNLALACASCNSQKGYTHDQHVGKGGRADEVVTALQAKRLSRWRENQSPSPQLLAHLKEGIDDARNGRIR